MVQRRLYLLILTRVKQARPNISAVTLVQLTLFGLGALPNQNPDMFSAHPFQHIDLPRVGVTARHRGVTWVGFGVPREALY